MNEIVKGIEHKNEIIKWKQRHCRCGSRIKFRVLVNFTKRFEQRNDVICRKVVDSANANCLGTWTFFLRGTFIWISLPAKFYKKKFITIRCVKSKGFYCRLFWPKLHQNGDIMALVWVAKLRKQRPIFKNILSFYLYF